MGSGGTDRRADGRVRALARLHLINVEEPFGSGMVGSLAGGTPVIAFARGSMPEIIRHGETGYIVEDIEHAVNAVAAVKSIDRSACRADVEQRFSHTRMARDYVDVYRKILNPGAGDDR